MSQFPDDALLVEVDTLPTFEEALAEYEQANSVEAAKDILRGAKFNPNHEPPGSPEGGQFTSATATGVVVTREMVTEREARDAAAAEAHREQRGYPQYLDISPEVKAGALSEASQESRRRTVDVQLAKWPSELQDAIAQVTVSVLENGHIGETSINAAEGENGGSWITIHPSIFINADMGKEQRISAEWVIHHEIAHAYVNYLMSRDGYDMKKATQTMRSAWVDQRFSARARGEMKRTTWYADTNNEEAFAEAVGMILSSGRVPGAYTKAAMQRLGITPNGVTLPSVEVPRV